MGENELCGLWAWILEFVAWDLMKGARGRRKGRMRREGENELCGLWAWILEFGI